MERAVSTPAAAWARSYASTCSASGPPWAVSWRTPAATTLPARSTTVAAEVRSGAVGAVVTGGNATAPRLMKLVPQRTLRDCRDAGVCLLRLEQWVVAGLRRDGHGAGHRTGGGRHRRRLRRRRRRAD